MTTPAIQSRHHIDLNDERFRHATREARVDKAAVNKADRTVDLSFASSQPVDRWFGREVLDITKDACDLSRLNSGGAVLVNHEWDHQVGVVEKAWIAGGVARARVKFSSVGRGAEIFQDIVDGIRRLVSVGYVVRKMVLQSVDGDVETHRVTDWQPFEVSIVSVPADPSVGVGRSSPSPEGRAPAMEVATRQNPSSQMSSNQVAASDAAEIMQECQVMVSRHPQHNSALVRLATECITAGEPSAVFRKKVLNEVLATNLDIAPGRAANSPEIARDLGLSSKDVQNYSLLRVVRARLEGRPLDGLEREAHEAEAKRLGRSAQGLFVPNEVFRAAYVRQAQRDLSVGTPSAGGYTVAEMVDVANIVPLLRNASHVVALGARTLSGLTGDVSIPRVLTGSTVYWLAENGSITSSSPTFGQILMRPRRIGGRVKITKQLAAQSSLDVENFVRTDIFDAFATEIDRVAINGAGGPEPLGILNLASGDRSTSVTFGAAATFAKVVEFETNVGTSNAISGAPAYLTTWATKGKWKVKERFTNAGPGIWASDEDVGGYRGRATAQFPSTPTANQVIFGDFGQVLIGEWTGNDVVIDPFTAAATGEVWITIQKIVDLVIRQGKAFAISTDSGAQ